MKEKSLADIHKEIHLMSLSKDNSKFPNPMFRFNVIYRKGVNDGLMLALTIIEQYLPDKGITADETND